MTGRLQTWPLLAAVAHATVKGFVNPLKHYDPATGGLHILNISDPEPLTDLVWTLQDFDLHLPEYFTNVRLLARRRIGKAQCQPLIVDTKNLWSTAERIQSAGFTLVGRYVNVGAADGFRDDPLHEYVVRTNATGVAVERDPERCVQHRAALPQVHVECSAVTPQNVRGLLAGVAAPQEMLDILKVDIDSYDCPVLEEILPNLTAKIVMVEANPSIPPPYQWAMLYHDGLWDFFNSFPHPEEVPIRGCSLAYEVDLMRRFGYDFIAFGGHDAVFTHHSVRSAWHPFVPPMDEFDCYLEAFIAANGIPMSATRRWFFEINDTQIALPEIWDFFTSWMQENAPRLFPFALRGS